MADIESSRWTIIGPGTSPNKVLCRCSCGVEKEVNRKNLKAGLTKSCGCLRREFMAEKQRRGEVKRHIIHGMSGTPEYACYYAIKQRCYNEKCEEYPNYGGRGVGMCKRWRDSFPAFYADMGNRPSSDDSIDRIDNEHGGYWCGKSECEECGPQKHPLNCRWTDDETQNRNRRNNRIIEHDGKPQTLQAWADHFKIEANVLAGRLDMGWDFIPAVTEPVSYKRLSDGKVWDIMRRYRPGVRGCGAIALADEFQTSPQTIERIIRGQIQKHRPLYDEYIAKHGPISLPVHEAGSDVSEGGAV